MIPVIHSLQSTSKIKERDRKNDTPKWNALTSGSSVGNATSDHDYSVFITKYYFFLNFTYPIRCFRVPPGVRVPQV
jgi:hypothetical protein